MKKTDMKKAQAASRVGFVRGRSRNWYCDQYSFFGSCMLRTRL
jgi:hypothetical protein